MGYLGTGDVTFAPGFQTRIPLGVRRIPSPCELLDKGLLVGEGQVCSGCHRAGPSTTQRHGQSEDHEKTRGVFGSEERPRHGKSFKLSPFSLCFFIYLFFIFFTFGFAHCYISFVGCSSYFWG